MEEPLSSWGFILSEAKNPLLGGCPFLKVSFYQSFSFQVFRSDGSNGYNLFTEEEANIEQKRNKPKKISPRMR